MRTIAARAFALFLLAPLVWGLSAYPAYPAWRQPLAAGLAVYAALLCWRPALWLLIVPALLPVFDLAPWTGWFFFDELDLLLLVTAAVGYWRWHPAPASAPLGLAPAVKPGLVLVAGCAALAAWRGVVPLAPLDANAFSSYLSPYNGLRVAKGFAWAALLLPLMRRHGAGGALRRLFVPGMLLGLAAASLAVAWERAVFPGLMNFSSDYRPTAPFSAMHTGGAALDAYLAMSFPFVACWLPGAPSRKHPATALAAALALLLLGVYAGLATFSRDVYLAYVCSGVVIGALTLAHQRRRGRLDGRKAMLTAALVAVAAALLQQVFGSSGYRGMLCAIGLLGGALLLAATARGALAGPGPAATAAIAAALLAAVLALFFVMRQDALPGADKGAYAGYGLAAAMLAAGVMLARAGSMAGFDGRAGAIVTAAAFPALALSTALVADHWGGAAAWTDIGLLIALATALVALRCWRGRPLWPLHRHSVGLALLCAIAMAVTIPLGSSYYMGSRFATVSGDLDVRLGHWSEALQMMDGDVATRAFGMGLGRYPATYLWNNARGEHPPTFSYANEDGNRFLRLGPPRYQAGYGEVLRMLQHVDMAGGQPYRLALDVRRGDDNTGMTVAVCERWLLYPESCAIAPLVLKREQRGWVHYEVALMAQWPPRRWPLRAPTQLEISVDGGERVVDVDNVLLADGAGGQNLVANGDFSHANDHWFFSSDHNHLPWHVKNFAVDVVFEMGWCGAFAMALLLLPLAAQLAGRGLRGERDAAVCLAALAGLMAVGLFDSIIDVPRLTLLFALIVFAGALAPKSSKN